MEWMKNDLQQFVQAKEYVDTAIVPLLPFQLSYDASLEKDAFQSEAQAVFLRELERELTGRIMMIPGYRYLKSADKESELNRLRTWIRDIQAQPFFHVFFITSDSGWKKHEQALPGTLIWLPLTAGNDSDPENMQPIIKEQVGEVSDLIKSYWHDDLKT
ncbi:YpiF family protein [Lentibacillus halophilus]|uniref:YpiF family protein n=1 Tax=Lentibacillus halophilus TaxID=295065 RepID=A0ABP3JAN5_9BACI